MIDKLIRNELSNFNEKQTFNDYEIILSYSTFSSLLNKKNTSMTKGLYKLLPNGGRGVWEPLSHSLFIDLLQ